MWSCIDRLWRLALILIATLLFLLTLAAKPAAAQTPLDKLTLTPPSALAHLRFTELAREEAGDVRSPHLPDARALAWAYQADGDRLWLRVTLESAPPGDWLGINVALDIDGNQANGQPWFGTNQAFRFDRLLTVWINRVGERYQGAVGIADAAGVARGALTNLQRGGLLLSVDAEARTVSVGARRGDLGIGRGCDLMVTVGSSFLGNDDLPHEGRVTIRLDSALDAVR